MRIENVHLYIFHIVYSLFPGEKWINDINDIENDHDEIKKNLLASYKLEVQNLVQHKKFLIIATDDEKKEYTDLLRELNDADS